MTNLPKKNEDPKNEETTELVVSVDDGTVDPPPTPDPREEAARKVAKEETEKRIKRLIQSLEDIQKRVPLSPKSLGGDILYAKKKVGLFQSTKRLPNISLIRDEVNKSTEKKTLPVSRKKIAKLIKKYPAYADLRVINGIQIFSDISQSGLTDKKYTALENALIEIVSGMSNGAISIFNATWMVKIYLKYLELLKEKITKELNGIKNHYNWQIRQVSQKLQKSLLQLNTLMTVKDKLGGLVMLNSKLKGSVYITDCITTEEIKTASYAILKDENKSIGVGKTANYVLLVIVTLSLLFARIPALTNLVQEILKQMPDISKDIVLQKHMINTMMGVTEYQLAMASGDKETTKKLADSIYKKSLLVIKKHMNFSFLTKPHEVDPFLKAAWIAKESKGVVDDDELKLRLKESSKLLRVVMRNQTEVKGSIELARHLQSEINQMLVEHGWEFYD